MPPRINARRRFFSRGNMKYAKRIVVEGFIAICLLLCALGISEWVEASQLETDNRAFFEILKWVMGVCAAVVVIDLLSLSSRRRSEVIEQGVEVAARVVDITYPFKYNPKDVNSCSFLLTKPRMPPPYTIHVQYTYNGKDYSLESRIQKGECPYKVGDFLSVFVASENPVEFYVK